MVPVSICNGGWSVDSGWPCSGTPHEAFYLAPLTGAEKLGATSSVNQDVAQSTFRKGIMFSGMRFHWAIRPASIDQSNSLVHASIRLAIVRLEIDGNGLPGLLPNLFSRLDSDMGDVLWRGAAMLKWPTYMDPDPTNAYAFSGTGDIGAVGSMSRLGHHGPPDVIKVKRRLDQQHALFFVAGAHNPTASEGGFTMNFGLDFYGVAAIRSIQR